jgi:hypothetical protein
MFHVSTLLPFTPNDEQQVSSAATPPFPVKHKKITRFQIERKRHLGNDVIMIVFKDSDSEPFSPNCVKSEFNRKRFFFSFLIEAHIFSSDVFAVISPVKSSNGKTHYRYQVGVKQGGKSVEPALPSPSVFEKVTNSPPFFFDSLICDPNRARFSDTSS